MRPAGMDDANQTNVGGERLQVDRDFILRRLEYGSKKDYKQFALDISKKRLENVDAFRSNNLCDINEILGKMEDYDTEANTIVKGDKHFRIIKRFFSDDEFDEVKKELSCDDKLMEMYNILRVYRGENYKIIGKLSREYRKLRDDRKLV